MHIFTATNSTRRCGFLHTSLLLALGLCQEKHYFICEKQRSGYLPNSSTITLNSNPTQEIICPHGWYKHNNNCYKVRNWRYWCEEDCLLLKSIIQYHGVITIARNVHKIIDVRLSPISDGIFLVLWWNIR